MCPTVLADQIYRNNFISAMEQWEMRTCIKFVERTTEADYVEMTEALRCEMQCTGLLFVVL